MRGFKVEVKIRLSLMVSMLILHIVMDHVAS